MKLNKKVIRDITSFLRENGYSKDNVDLEAYWDSTLTYSENLSALSEKFGLKRKLTRGELKARRIQSEKYRQESFDEFKREKAFDYDEGRKKKKKRFGKRFEVLEPNKNKARGKFRYSAFDIESFHWTEPFMLGFYDGEEYFHFEGKNCVEQFLMTFLKKKYRSYHSFAHYGGGYDFNFVLETMQDSFSEYNLRVIARSGQILQLTVTKKSNRWYLNDSLALLPASLKKLTHGFDVEHKKLDEDRNALGYNDETRLYLKHDVLGLYEVLAKFRKIIKAHKLKLTISSQAMNIFKSRFLKIAIPQYPEHEKFIRKGFYGGRVEVFKMYFDGEESDRLYYYDFNSLYPSIMFDCTMPVGKPKFRRARFVSDYDLGFAEAVIEIPEKEYIPLLPVRKKKLLFPVGKIKGVWDLEELKLARDLGYSVKFSKALIFPQEFIFRDYVKEYYGIKQEADKGTALRIISKLMLNSLFGKFGQKRIRETTYINPDFRKVDIRKLKMAHEGLNMWSRETKNYATFILPAISSHITSMSRIKLFNAFREVENDVYYCDTDSLITSSKLRTSKKLGALKQEDKIKEAVFLSPKLYAYLPNPRKTEEIKAKGFQAYRKIINKETGKEEKKQILFFEDFKKALFKNDFSGFNQEREVFGKFKESIRREKKFVTMITRKKSLKSVYDKRKILKNFDTKPLKM